MTHIVPSMFYSDDSSRFNIDRVSGWGPEYEMGLRDPFRYTPRKEDEFFEMNHYYHDSRFKMATDPELENHYVTQVSDWTNASVAASEDWNVHFGAQNKVPGYTPHDAREFRDFSEHPYVNEDARVWERTMPITLDPTQHPKEHWGEGDAMQNTNMLMRRDLSRRDPYAQSDWNLQNPAMEPLAEPGPYNPEIASHVRVWGFPERTFISQQTREIEEPDGLLGGYLRIGM